MTVLSLQVAASADDAYQVNTTSSIIGTAHTSDATNEWFGFRWQGVTIAQGSTITEAILSVNINSGTLDDPDHTFYGEAADNAAEFTADASNISDRPRTTATVVWQSLDLGVTGGDFAAVPDVKTLVQEIIDRAGWASGNALVIVCHGSADVNRDLALNMYDSSAAFGATLVITYTAPAAVPDGGTARAGSLFQQWQSGF